MFKTLVISLVASNLIGAFLLDVQYPQMDYTSSFGVVFSDLETETSTTAEPDVQYYLELEDEYDNREDYWKANIYECINGTLQPPISIRRKFQKCQRIHRNTPQCINFCQLAVLMLLGDDQLPTIGLYEKYFEIVLPTALRTPAAFHYRSCFNEFGHSKRDFKDPLCFRSLQFFKCVEEFDTQMVC